MTSTRRSWTIAVAATAICACLGLTACDATSSTSPTAAPAFELTAQTPAPSGSIDSFTWSLFAEPASLAYYQAFDYPPNQVLANVCESLLRWNPDLTVSPGLAESFSNPTPTTWVYKIRSGVTFHDGSPLTAADVVASLRMHLDPAVASYWAGVYKNVASIDQTGPLEVTVTTTIPDSQFNQYMAAAPGVVESAATLAAAGANYGNPSTGVNCTGPFQFSSWTPGSDIVLTRYDGYWDQSLAARSGKVKFVFLNDPTARVAAFQSGDVDGGWQVPTSGLAQLKSSTAGKLYFGVNTAVSAEIVSNLSGPLGDPKVRKALLMAIDRNGIIQAAQGGYATLSNALTTRSVWGASGQSAESAAFDGLATYDYDVAAAKKLADEAGVAGKKIVIASSSATVSEGIVAQAVQAAAKAIGLQAEISPIAPDKYGALFVDPAARTGIDLFFTDWYASTSDPMETLGVLQTANFSNFGGWSNSAYDALDAQAEGTMDAAARGQISAQLQQMTNDQLPWLPLYSAPTSLWLGKRISGVAPSIAFLYYPWAATIGAS